MLQIELQYFNQKINQRIGICTSCNEYVGGIRPTAEGAVCPHCSNRTSVIGIQEAKDRGLITITKNKKKTLSPEDYKANIKRKQDKIEQNLENKKKTSSKKKKKNRVDSNTSNAIIGIPSEKRQWSRADFRKYHTENDKLSDYSCNKNGVIEKRHSLKKSGKK